MSIPPTLVLLGRAPSTTELWVRHWDQHLTLTFLRSVTQFTGNLGLCLRGTGLWFVATEWIRIRALIPF